MWGTCTEESEVFSDFLGTRRRVGSTPFTQHFAALIRPITGFLTWFQRQNWNTESNASDKTVFSNITLLIVSYEEPITSSVGSSYSKRHFLSGSI